MKKSGINKAACKRLAAELRSELGLALMDALDPWKLAELYGVEIYLLSELPVSAETLDHFTISNPNVFSGALVPFGTGAVIIENDAHAPVRRRSTMGHELAHVVKEHKFEASIVNERGCRTADRMQEDEATEIAGELLIPFDAARRLAQAKVTDDEVAIRFGVSSEFARWRMDSTGARLIARRQEAAYRRVRGA